MTCGCLAMRWRLLVSLFLLAAFLGTPSVIVAADTSSSSTPTQATTSSTTTTTYTRAVLDKSWELLESYPHDRKSFTQGLEILPSYQMMTSNSCKWKEEQGNDNSDDDDASNEPTTTSSSSPTETTSSSPSSQDGEGGTESSSPSSQQESSKSPESSSPSQQESPTSPPLWLMESTGMRGDSYLRIWDLETGTVHKELHLEDRFFGEGSTRYVDQKTGQTKIAILTWQEESILVVDAVSLELLETLDPWPSQTTTKEGWGIAWDGENHWFVVSDGSNVLHFWDDQTFQPIDDSEEEKNQQQQPSTVSVHIDELVDESGNVLVEYNTNGGTPIGYLNELEWDASTNTVLANIWTRHLVARIDPKTGKVVRLYDFSGLHTTTQPPSGYSREDVFNGIAIVPNTNGKEWLVTGKYWPTIYKIRIQE